MIERPEIEERAQALEINVADVQRDYVFGWFLFGLYSMSQLGDKLFLKGGNALRKGYFENTRYSSDLDFGMQQDIDPNLLKAEINKICEYVHEHTGITFRTDLNTVKEKFAIDNDAMSHLKVYEAKVCFQDFYGNAKHIVIKIKMDITRFDKVYLPLQDQALIHSYSDFADVRGTIKCSKLEEILGTKLKCILQREHAPDLFDYVYAVFFNDKIALNKGEVVSVFLQKTIFEPSPGMAKNILLNLPLDFFRAFWDKNIVCAKGTLFDVETAVAKFNDGIRDMFAPYPEVSYADSAFFPPKFRNPIMQAGRTQTLLKMVYKNSERMVEPYALKYKEAQGKAPREYFFVYELSGGSKGVPGVRSYVAENVQSIENTEEKFSPRDGHEIELCKAGDPVEDKYFTDPNKPRKAPRARVRASSSVTRSGPRYVYRCAACSKTVTKRTQSSTIGPHKNKYGGQCYGRYGYLVRTVY